MVMALQKYSQFPKNKVVGMAGILDTSRYKLFLSEEFDVPIKKIDAMVMGGHGDTMVPLPGYTKIDGKKIYAGKEVIISQGAFGTPHLLMLSGIGDANHLISHDVKPIIDLPGVGQNLADHLDVSIQYGSDRMDLSAARYQRIDQAALLLGRWLMNGSGPGGGSLFSSMLFHSFDDPNYPELQIFMTPMNIDENLSDGKNETTSILQSLGRKLLVRGKKVAKPGVQIDINLERPKSLGRIRLNSSNPLDLSLIHI